MDLIEIERMIAEATVKLEAKNTQLGEDLAAAQATIAEMRGYFWRDVSDELPKEAQEVLFVRDNKVVHGAWINGIFWHSNTKMVAAKWMPFPPVDISTLSIPTNLDALHEARALECERLADKSEQGMLLCNELIEQAAAHRARKEGK